MLYGDHSISRACAAVGRDVGELCGIAPGSPRGIRAPLIMTDSGLVSSYPQAQVP
jgi:hypothetical protein